MKKSRIWITRFLPAIAVLLVAGLLLSRTPIPEKPAPEAGIRVSAYLAADHIGEVAEVCGMVESARFIPAVRGEPAFLNLGRPYPDQVFTVVIWGEDRDRFRVPPEKRYSNRDICVTGRIRMHEGVPQVRVRHPDQIVER